MGLRKLLLIFSLTLSTFANAAENQATVLVYGMVCAFCAQGVTKKFQEEAAVKSVDVSLMDKTVTIEFKPNQTLSDARITEILVDSGFNVQKIERNSAKVPRKV